MKESNTRSLIITKGERIRSYMKLYILIFKEETWLPQTVTGTFFIIVTYK